MTSAFVGLFAWLLFVTPFSISAIEITFPVLLLLWLWGLCARRPAGLEVPFPTRQVRGILLALLAYMAVCFFSLAYSHFRVTTARGLVGKLLEYSLLYAICLHAARQPGAPRACLRAIQLAAWLVVLHSLLQQWAITHSVTAVRDPILRYRYLDYLRIVGPYKNPIDLATYLMVVGLLLLSLLFDDHRRRSAGRTLLLGLVLWCFVWTQSLGALIGLLAGLSFLGVRHRHQPRTLVALAALAVGTSALLLFLEGDRLWATLTLADLASRDRATMWNTAWAMIGSKPWLGLGYNTFMANYGNFASDRNVWPAYAHNCYLQIAAETGVVGLSAFAAFLVLAIRLWWRALQSSAGLSDGDRFSHTLLAGLVAGLIAFLVQSTFDTNLYALRQAVLFWSLAGAATGLSVRVLQPSPLTQRAR